MKEKDFDVTDVLRKEDSILIHCLVSTKGEDVSKPINLKSVVDSCKIDVLKIKKVLKQPNELTQPRYDYKQKTCEEAKETKNAAKIVGKRKVKKANLSDSKDGLDKVVNDEDDDEDYFGKVDFFLAEMICKDIIFCMEGLKSIVKVMTFVRVLIKVMVSNKTKDNVRD